MATAFLADHLQMLEEGIVVVEPALDVAQGFKLVETILTGRHEIMKTGWERSWISHHLHFHVFMVSCFPVENR